MAVVTRTPAAARGQQFRSVAAHARRPHHHVHVGPVHVGRSLDRPGPAQRPGHPLGRRVGLVVDQDRLDPPPHRQGRQGQSLRPHAPHGHAPGQDALEGQRVGRHRSPARRASTAAATAGSSKARSGSGVSSPVDVPVLDEAVRHRRQGGHHRRVPPRRPTGQQAQRDRGLAPLTHALERLVGVAHEGGEPGHLVRVGEHVRADDGGQPVRLEERRQHQSDEPALRAVPAPSVGRAGALAEGGVTAAEGPVVPGESGERPGDGQLRVGPQRRAVGQLRGRRCGAPGRPGAARTPGSSSTGG